MRQSDAVTSEAVTEPGSAGHGPLGAGARPSAKGHVQDTPAPLRPAASTNWQLATQPGQESRSLSTRLEPRRTTRGPGLAARRAQRPQNQGRRRSPSTNPQPWAARARCPGVHTQAHLQRRSGRPRPGRRWSPRSRSAGTRSAGGPRCGRGWAGSAPARPLHGHVGESEAVHSGLTPATLPTGLGPAHFSVPQPRLAWAPPLTAWPVPEPHWTLGDKEAREVGWAPPDLPLRPAPPAGPGLSRLGQWGGNPGEECGPCLSGDSRLQRAARAAGGLGRWPGPDRAGSAHAPHRWASPPRPQAQHRLSPPAPPPRLHQARRRRPH